MEVPGKLAFCDLCKAQNRSTEADGFCVDCDEYMCQTCFTMHSLLKHCRNHVLSATDEGKAKQVHTNMKTEKCQLHQEEIVKYYCRSHDVIACVDCVVIDHRQCKVEFIRDISKNVCESSDFKDLLSKIQQLEADNKACDKLRTNNEIENNALLDKAASEIRKFRKELNDYLDNAEKEILEEAKQLTKENEKKMSTLEEKILSIMRKMSELKNKLDLKSSQDEALFIRLIECKPDVKKIEQTLSDLKLITDIKCFTFVRDETLEDLLKSRPKIGSLKSHQQPQGGKSEPAETLEKTVRPKSKQKHGQKESPEHLEIVQNTPTLGTEGTEYQYMPPDPRAHGFFVGTRVECQVTYAGTVNLQNLFPRKEWWKGKVNMVHPDGYVDVNSDDSRIFRRRVPAGANGKFDVRLV